MVRNDRADESDTAPQRLLLPSVRYRREDLRYATDVTNAEWAFIEPHMNTVMPPAANHSMVVGFTETCQIDRAMA